MRYLLFRTLAAFVSRLDSLRHVFKCEMVRQSTSAAKADPKVEIFESESIELSNIEHFMELDLVKPIHVIIKPLDGSGDHMRDIRIQFKTILLGVKTTLFNLRQAGVVNSDYSDIVSTSFQDEMDMFVGIFVNGIDCFQYYLEEETLDSSTVGFSISKEDKETIEAFASIFTFVEPFVFQEVFSNHIEVLFDYTLRTPSILAVSQYFLANSAVSANFSGLLLRFLVFHLEELGGPDENRSTALFRHFKLVFMAVTLFPDHNEPVLRPHLANIIMTCLKCATRTSESIHYFLLLRTLFRNIGGGRFEALYQEVLPLLQVLLENLNTLLLTAQSVVLKELFVELCLTVPVRLSVLLPHLSYLMKPLVIALQGGTELASQSLRTLELCVDNLNQDFLEPIIAPVFDELMNALRMHLQPAPYHSTHSHTAMRILGKFGGRNRKVFNDQFKFVSHTSSALQIKIMIGTSIETMDISTSVEIAKKILQDGTYSSDNNREAFRLCNASIGLIFEEVDITNYSKTCKSVVAQLKSYVAEQANREQPGSEVSPFVEISEMSQSRIVALKSALVTLLTALFSACILPDLESEAYAVVEGICGYFAVLAIEEAVQLASSKPYNGFELLNAHARSRVEGFIEAILETLSSDSPKIRAVGEKATRSFYHACQALLADDSLLAWIPAFRIMASRFSSSCYPQEWSKKIGGCMGLDIITKIPFSPEWMLEHELEFVKALLYVLKDVSPTVAYFNLDTPKRILEEIIDMCHRKREVEILDEPAKFSSLLALLIAELSNSNASVRETVQILFSKLSELKDIVVTDLLTPVRDRLLAPIFTKPLRALPFALQIGHIDAITYCLSLRPVFLPFNEELVRLLHEALALSDAEDQALASKSFQFKNVASVIHLRVVCIKLLSVAMTCPDFASPRETATRARIISVFFKSLYAKSAEVVQVANEGLEKVLLLQHKLPKDLLQGGLRPILVNLSDHKRLSVAGLEGLARLLQLLTNYFKVEIGRKLLDHLRQWATPEKLEEISGRPILDIEEVKIIVCILDIFPLLPAAANVFLDDLVTQVLDLEIKVHRTHSSPFRKPLCAFLNRYAKESVDYFFARLVSNVHISLLVGILEMDKTGQLMAETINNVSTDANFEKALANCGIDAGSVALHRNAVMLVELCCRTNDEWVLESPLIPKLLNARAGQRQLTVTQNACRSGNAKLCGIGLKIRFDPYECGNIPLVRYTRCVFTIMMRRISVSQDLDMLFALLSAFTDSDLVDTGFIKKFIYEEILLKYTSEMRRNVILLFLKNFQMNESQMYILRYLVLPMLLIPQAQPSEVLTSEVVQEVLVSIWSPLTERHGTSNGDTETTMLELLQFTTLLMTQIPEVVNEFRKDVIKFAWALLKVDDITLKQSAYVLLSRFIREYETPPKIVTQIYVAQLRAHQPEGRALVRQALDTMIRVLPMRFASTPSESSVIPVWIQWIRKVLVDDGHNVTQLVTIYQLIIRHATLFYDSREHFVPQIISSLSKLGLSSNSTVDTRLLTLELGELILKWEDQEQENATEMKVDSETDGALASSAAATNSYKEVIISYFVRFCLALHDPQLQKRLFPRAIAILARFYEKYPVVSVKLSQLEKVSGLAIEGETNLNININASEVLLVILTSNPVEWLSSNLALVTKCICNWMASENISLITNVSVVVKRVFAVIDELKLTDQKYTEDKAHFLKAVENFIQAGLRSWHHVSALVSIMQASYLDRLASDQSIQVLKSNSVEIVQLLNLIVSPTGQMPLAGIVTPTEDLVISLLRLANVFVSQMGETRKSFIACIMKLIEMPGVPEVHRLLLKMLRQWVFENSSFPTMKEKANIAVKMMTFEQLEGVEIFEEFMKFVVDIYDSERFARTELTVRLEPAFMHGTRMTNFALRRNFRSILENSVPNPPEVRLKYIFGIQSWEGISDYFWIHQALDLLFGSSSFVSVVSDAAIDVRLKGPNENSNGVGSESMMNCDFDSALESKIKSQSTFLKNMQNQSVEDMIWNLRNLMYVDDELAYNLWVTLFPKFWDALSTSNQHDIMKDMIGLLAQPYHFAQARKRPNVIQAILEGACRCTPAIPLPAQLVKYLGETYNCWHIALALLQKSSLDIKGVIGTTSKDEEKINENIIDCMAEIYSDLSEEDYFAGIWRRRSLFAETSAAISFEQSGLWHIAQKHYENAQAKARTGVLPFSEYEYCLWERQWVNCTQKLQQWDILTDLAKHDSNPELLLESSWRIADWTTDRDALMGNIQALPDPPDIRKKFFEAYAFLLRVNDPADLAEFNVIQEAGIELALQRWNSLPSMISAAHISSFHTFQQFVELQEASVIQMNLLSTNVANIDAKSQELKGILQTWRERLPNIWDDINIWSDLVAWRQQVFTCVNKAYLPLIPQLSSPANGNPTSSYTYRGYHETAWIINRFAHVARKHQLPEVCMNSLSKIYTLPNIEIQEAFFKLYEQAKCHLFTLAEYSIGLDVINNTNLLYFSNTQKAEFWTLKGQFFSHLNLIEDAAAAFSTAVQLDMNLPKSWACYGEYNDRLFTLNPTEFKYAADAVTCYLNAAGLPSCNRPRQYLARILFLISSDDESGTLVKAYEGSKAEIPVWYWITFIPQLLTSLSGREARISRTILMKIAKAHPQSLHFQLRTAKEDLNSLKRQHNSMNAKASEAGSPDTSQQQSPSKGTDMATDDEDPAKQAEAQLPVARHPWEYVDEIMGLLKTAFPLLALSMETMVDQILQRLKPTTDEDIYRLIVALLNDGVQMYLQQLAKDPLDGGALSSATEGNLLRFAESMQPNHIKYKPSFEQDFIISKPNLSQLVDRFRNWRNRLEALLDSRPKRQNLEHFSHYLAEFEYQKFDEIEIPGQYFQMRFSPKGFVKIDRFDPDVGVVRGHAGCHRSLIIHGHDGSKRQFAVQHPAAKQCRREERILQFFRILNEYNLVT